MPACVTAQLARRSDFPPCEAEDATSCGGLGAETMEAEPHAPWTTTSKSSVPVSSRTGKGGRRAPSQGRKVVRSVGGRVAKEEKEKEGDGSDSSGSEQIHLHPFAPLTNDR